MYSDILPPEGLNKGDYSSVRAVFPNGYAAVISAGEIGSGKEALLIKDPAGNGSGTIAGASSAAPLQRGRSIML